MAEKTYHGSCVCQAVRFEARIDLQAGTFKCNCTRCTKGRMWAASIKPDAIKFQQGEGDLTVYGENIKGMFCRRCGTGIGGRGELEQAGGKFVAVMLASLDDLDPREWAAAPVAYLDGRHDRWDREPEFKGHM